MQSCIVPIGVILDNPVVIIEIAHFGLRVLTIWLNHISTHDYKIIFELKYIV